MKIYFTIIFALIYFQAFSQRVLIPEDRNDSTILKRGKIVYGNFEDRDDSLIIYVTLREIKIFPKRKFKNRWQRRRYTRLMYNVKKVYPYAKIINRLYYELERQLDTITDPKERKKFIKIKEKELKDQWQDQLVSLTFTQGRLLIKLVDRETGNSTYDVIKEFKGSMSAFFWQSLAMMFGTNLKVTYDPDEEDQMIEEIIAMIENGQL